MRLTTFCDYGLRTLMYLAVAHEGGQESVPTSAIAEDFGVSMSHLAKVAQSLVQHGFVTSKRGRDGGIRLFRSPTCIRVGEVVRALEPSDLVPCFERAEACPITGSCGLNSALARAQECFLASLDEVTLADCVVHPKGIERLIGLRVASA